MLFDHCAQCQRCCHVDEDYPPLEVTLTRQEKTVYGSVCIETRCEHLGPVGCQLAEAKPVSCKLYPLSYAPQTRSFHFDVECPLKSVYFEQLANADSEASLHFSRMAEMIQNLEHTDQAFLATNYAIDLDYFELEVLPVNPWIDRKLK
jgi:Fe-S-cluster containining protein